MRPIRLVICLLAVLLAWPAVADAGKQGLLAGWTGAAGVGPIVFPRYTGGSASQVWLIPIISAEYKDVVYIEPLRAGAYLWGSTDRKMGLGVAVEPRFGFAAGDGRRLTGMATRGNSLEGGPAFDWDLGPFALSVSLFTDLTNASRGQSARLYAYRQIFQDDRWKLGGYVGVDWMSRRVSNYFFGVNDREATIDRPAFHPGSTSNGSAGFDGHYRMSQDYSLLFGLQVSRLGQPAANSPIVDTRQSFVGWLGLAWNL